MPFQQRPHEKLEGPQGARALTSSGGEVQNEDHRKANLKPVFRVTPFKSKGRRGRAR